MNNGQHAHFSWNHQANGINMRINLIIPTTNLSNFQIFPAPQLFQLPQIY